MKNILKYLIIFVGLILFFVISLTLTALIPTELIKENVEESAETLYEEKEYYEKEYLNKNILYDNYADAIMINNAYSMDPAEPLYSALIVRRNYIPGVTIEILPEETGNPTRLIYETQNLLNVVKGKRIIAKQYSKYWHGYLIILKPLLILFNYSQIRILQLILIMILIVLLLYLIFRKIGIIQAIIFLLGFLIIDIEFIYMSLEFTPVFIIMLGVSIFMLISKKRIKDKGKIFFISGMLTSFFDFLTVPLITLGIPLIIYFLLKPKETKLNIKEIIKLFIVNCLVWFLGYALTWIAKFLLVDILYHKNLLLTGFEQVFHRTLGKTSALNMDFTTSLEKNLQNCNIWIFAIFCIFEIIYFIYRKMKYKTINNIKIKTILPYLLVAILPFLWYIILQEHSIRHAFFTYRATSVFWIGIMIVVNLINTSVRGKNVKN